jgi:threonine/homoserine efflux transporter RhtA
MMRGAMKNRILTVVAVLLLAFPFVMVAYELAIKESITTLGLFVAIALVLFGTIIVAMMVSRPKSS